MVAIKLASNTLLIQILLDLFSGFQVFHQTAHWISDFSYLAFKTTRNRFVAVLTRSDSYNSLT